MVRVVQVEAAVRAAMPVVEIPSRAARSLARAKVWVSVTEVMVSPAAGAAKSCVPATSPLREVMPEPAGPTSPHALPEHTCTVPVVVLNAAAPLLFVLQVGRAAVA
jgi:hypothetical protein